MSDKASEKTGRRAKLTSEIAEEICSNIQAGMPKAKAASLSRVSESALYLWLKKGREAIEDMLDQGLEEPADDVVLYVEFMEGVARAEALFVSEGVRAIRAEGPAGYRWLLARLFRAEFGDQLELKTDLPDVIQLKLPGMVKRGTDDEGAPDLLQAPPPPG